MSESIRVAAVQCTSVTGQGQRNLDNASRHVAEAAERGAQLIVCPEFLATGYIFAETIWDAGEQANVGRTEMWLAAHARDLGTLVGASYLEAEGDDFYNTFALYGPDGVLGRVRKLALPVFEGRYFKPCPEPKIIETPIGRLAIGICQDNHTRGFLEHVASMQPDVILMPHSAPSPVLGFGPLDALGTVMFDQQLDSIASRFATALGIPVILSNKVSDAPFEMPIPLVPRIRVPMRFHGYSRIVDADGSTLGRLVDQQGVIVADISTNPSHRRVLEHSGKGYWSFGPGLLSAPLGKLLELLDAAGRRSYRTNPRRAAKARAARSRAARARAAGPRSA